mgnify:CR=1 FL=1
MRRLSVGVSQRGRQRATRARCDHALVLARIFICRGNIFPVNPTSCESLHPKPAATSSDGSEHVFLGEQSRESPCYTSEVQSHTNVQEVGKRLQGPNQMPVGVIEALPCCAVDIRFLYAGTITDPLLGFLGR